MAIAALFAIFAILGLMVALLGHAAKYNSPAPSMYQSDATGWGVLIFIVAGLIALAAFADAYSRIA